MKLNVNDLKEIANGNFEVKFESDCGCSIPIDGWVYNPISSRLENTDICIDACWVGKNAYYDNRKIATYDSICGLDLFFETHPQDDIELEEAIEKLSEELYVPANTHNNSHLEKERYSLIEFCKNLREKGFLLMRDNLRGFANEYCMLIISPDMIEENIDLIKKCDELTPEEWADEYMYKGDAFTQPYVSFNLIGILP